MVKKKQKKTLHYSVPIKHGKPSNIFQDFPEPINKIQGLSRTGKKIQDFSRMWQLCTVLGTGKLKITIKPHAAWRMCQDYTSNSTFNEKFFFIEIIFW